MAACRTVVEPAGLPDAGPCDLAGPVVSSPRCAAGRSSARPRTGSDRGRSVQRIDDARSGQEPARPRATGAWSKRATARWLALAVAAARSTRSHHPRRRTAPAREAPLPWRPSRSRRPRGRPSAARPRTRPRLGAQRRRNRGPRRLRVRARATAPDSVIIRVPDGLTKAGSGARPRLVERTRYGLLPRIGADGTRPAQVYARPAADQPAPGVASS